MRIPIALSVLALALLVVPGAFADRSYTDPAGDSGAAPDITAVNVSHDAGGTLSFALATNQPTLAADASFWVYFDTDRNPSTGLPYRGLGAERFFVADADGGFLLRVEGSFLVVDFNSSLSASFANGTLTARLNRSDLGSTERFGFLVESELDDANGDAIASDFAPDAPPAYEYSFVPLVLTVGPLARTPTLPVGGKRFVVSASVTRSDGQPFAAGTVSCIARAGTVALKPAVTGASGSARCAMKVPKSSKGKMLRGSLTVSAEDSAPVKRTFAYRIR